MEGLLSTGPTPSSFENNKHLKWLELIGGKRRPHETLTIANSKVLYTMNDIILTASVNYCNKFFELIQNTLFMEVET